MLIVHQFAGILLDMDAFDADPLGAGFGVLFVQHDVDRALAHDGVIELADLIALRQIRVEIIFPVEARPFVDLRLDRHTGAHRLPDAFAVGDRQHAGHRRIDKGHLRIGLRAERRRRARKQLGVRRHLRMDLQADHDLPFAGCALDAIG